MHRLLLACLLIIGTPAFADPISVTKLVIVVSDPLGNAIPRGVPGAVIDYNVTFGNPATNALLPVRNMVYEEALPANVKLRVSDLTGAGSGPVAFIDGAIVLGIGDSGLTYTFTSLSSTTDGIDFFNGISWSYIPVPDANGYDANVRAIRVKPVTTFKTGGSFTLRYRAQIQ
jgi:hypothetical protein